MKWIAAMLFVPAIAAAGLAKASGPDHIYLYENGRNRNFQCKTFLAYFNTGTESLFYADRCTQTGQDQTVWPHFVPITIRLSLDFAPRRAAVPEQPRIFRDCLFVAHAQNPDRTTSTVIDCRQANAAATAR